MRKADTTWTDQDGEDQKCVNYVNVRIDDRVISVECTKQDVIALSAIQSESYTLITGELGRVPSDDSETDLGTKYLERDRIERCLTRMLIVGGSLGRKTVAYGFVHWIDHWGGPHRGSQLYDGCVCAVFDLHLPTGNVHWTG